MSLVRAHVSRATASIATTALIAGMLVFAGGAAPASAATPIAGAQTSGDKVLPGQGNGGYDALHYDIDMTVNVTVATSASAASTTTVPAATATILARTTGAPLSSYSFDFQGSKTTLAASTLNVTSVTVNGVAATFTREETTNYSTPANDKHKLVITPATPVDGEFTTVVKYSGTPVIRTAADGQPEGWINTNDGVTVVGQPVGSMTAFPNNATPSDKATWTVSLNVPSQLTAPAGSTTTLADTAAVSNGELVSRTPSSNGARTTWKWNQPKPMASELSIISIGRYDMYSSEIALDSGQKVKEWSFVDPALNASIESSSLAARANIKPILNSLAARYGEYPGSSVGFINDVVPSTISWQMESQDRPLSGTGISTASLTLLLANQWFGSSVTPATWNDMWLAAGIGAHAAALVAYEDAGTSQTPTENTYYGTPRLTTWTSLATSTVPADIYTNTGTHGAAAMEALRTAIGASDFDRLLNEWATRYAGTSRTTADFTALAAEISGKNLTAFFKDWLYDAGEPAWPAKYSVALTGPAAPVNAGDAVTYTLTNRNTGKVTQTGSIVTVDVASILANSTLGTLPSGVTRAGNVLRWTVPSTAAGASAVVDIPVRVGAGATGATISATATATGVGASCVACSASIVVGAAPVSPLGTVSITGTPTVGSALSAVTADWAEGTTFAYQWLVGGQPVPGATTATFTPDRYAQGSTVTVTVTAANGALSPVSTTSAATATITAAAQGAATATITGTPRMGETLAAGGDWRPGTRFVYQWLVGGTAITAAAGGTGDTFTPNLNSYIGKTVTVRITGTRAGYASTIRTSDATAPIEGLAQSAVPVPTIPATSRVGVPITARPGTWDTGTTQAYAWLLDGTVVGTALTITPTSDFAGKTLAFRVTSTRTLYATEVVTSTGVVVAPGIQSRTPTPVVSGDARFGATLGLAPGTWDAGTVQAYQWYADGTAIPDATELTFTVAAAQVGARITASVTSTREGYTTVTRTSAQTSAVAALDQALTPTPTISGTPRVAESLTALPGEWDTEATLGYQWFADDVAIDGATSETFVPGADEYGAVVTVAVTGTRPGYTTVTKSSRPTEVVAAGVLVATPVPTIDGTAKALVALAAVPGDWDAGTVLSYQWLVNDVPVAGATAQTYAPTLADIGSVVSVAVTGTRPGYTPATRTSTQTSEVRRADLASTPVPGISGTPRVDSDLSAETGEWDADIALSYQWFADDEFIDGATAATFTPGVEQLDAVITVAVTGEKPGYTAVTRTSDPTDAITEGDLVATPTPLITGQAKARAVLTAVAGAWDAGVTLAYQWYADGEPVDGATSETFTPSLDDIESVLTVRVTGTRFGYVTVSKTSAATSAIATAAFELSPDPTVGGESKVAVELTADAGTWDDGARLSYQWFAGYLPIEGADAESFTPGVAELGATITVSVTATKDGYDTTTRSSIPTSAVAAGDLVATPVPTIPASARALVELTADAGTWDDNVSLAYQWLADGTAIPGETSASFTPGLSYIGAEISVIVTGSRPGYATTARESAATSAVAAADFTHSPVPSVVGDPQVGVDLTVETGEWDDLTSLDIQWLSDGAIIDGATGESFAPGVDEFGTEVTVEVTGSKDGFVTTTRTSSPTVAVAAGETTPGYIPAVSGNPVVGAELLAIANAWAEGTTLAYQWYADGDAIDGATGTTFVVDAAHVGRAFAVRVTGTRYGYETESLQSNPTRAAAAIDSGAIPTPGIAGRAQVGLTVMAEPGTWVGDGVGKELWETATTFTYKWLRNGRPIPGATSSTYTLRPVDNGRALTVRITSTTLGVTAEPVIGGRVVVAAGVQALHPKPKITGAAKVGLTVRLSVGPWDAASKIHYRWYRDGRPIAGAYKASYTLQPADRTHKLTVSVKGTRNGYTRVIETSTGKKVAAGVQTKRPKPAIAGTAKVGKTLSVKKATYDKGVSLRYSWYADGKKLGVKTSTLKIGAKLEGKRITVTVTQKKQGYTKVVRQSTRTARVK